MKTVSDILQRIKPQFNTIEAGNRVMDAMAIMKTEESSFVIVTRGGKYVGIVTERDYAQKVVLVNRTSYETKIEEIMNCNLPTVTPGDSVERCMMLMNAYKTRYLPVFDDFDFKAVLTMNDIILSTMVNKEHEEYFKESNERVF